MGIGSKRRRVDVVLEVWDEVDVSFLEDLLMEGLFEDYYSRLGKDILRR